MKKYFILLIASFLFLPHLAKAEAVLASEPTTSVTIAQNLPDLVPYGLQFFDSAGRSIKKDDLKSGETVAVRFLYKNEGTAKVGKADFRVNIYYDGALKKSFIKSFNDYLNNLSDNLVLINEYQLVLEDGHHEIKIEFDADDNVIELSESNNTYAEKISLNIPTAINIEPRTDTEGMNDEIKAVPEAEKDEADNGIPSSLALKLLGSEIIIQSERDSEKEANAKSNYLVNLFMGQPSSSSSVVSAITDFIVYGVDDNTRKLGEGERAAVVYSYKIAFQKLPETEEELDDAIRIANGRWPGKTSKQAEKKAEMHFEKIYRRIADMDNPNDNAAITVMSYGLRQKAENRNLKSEAQGIKTFMAIYGHNPNSTEEWNVMQAITYSGVSRGKDTDGDLLVDDREEKYGTDKSNPDTDRDGYRDGDEVVNGYNPRGAGAML